MQRVNEIKQYLRNRASFLVPTNIEENVSKYGNRGLYDNQLYQV